MTRLVPFLAVLALAPALADAGGRGHGRTEEDGDRVLLLRTQESPDVTPVCPDGDNIRLGAYVYAPRTRWNGLVANEGDRPIGTAIGCGKISSLLPYQPNDFSMRFALDRGVITAKGKCYVGDGWYPLEGVPAPVLLVGCTLTVDPDSGIAHGIATSASVFLLASVPGFDTGSYWTIRLYAPE
jgi:hypothetical protein